MQGENIFIKLSQRDYSGTNSDQYAQLLNTIFYNLSGNDEIKLFYDLLEKADQENKFISISDPENIKDEYSFSDLIITDKFY